MEQEIKPLKKMVLSKVRIKPYKSNSITVTGEAIRAVTYDLNTK